MKPTINIDEDIMSMRTIYRLSVPRAWMVEKKWFKFSLTWWLIKMIWSKP